MEVENAPPEVPAVNQNIMYLDSELDVTEKLAFSDSENESPNRSKKGATPETGYFGVSSTVGIPTLDGDDDDSDIEHRRTQRKNCNKLIDSESEDETIPNFYDMECENDQLKISKPKKGLIDSDSTSTHNSNNESDTEIELRTTKVKKLHKKLPSNNTLEENEVCICRWYGIQIFNYFNSFTQLTTNLRKLCDDDSSSDEEANHSDGNIREATKALKRAPKERPPKRV